MERDLEVLAKERHVDLEVTDLIYFSDIYKQNTSL